MSLAHPTLGGSYSDGDAQVEEWKADVIDGTCSTVTENWLRNQMGLSDSNFDDAYLQELFQDLIIDVKKLNKSPSFNINSPTGGTGIRAQLEAAGASDCVLAAVDTSATYTEDDSIDASSCSA